MGTKKLLIVTGAICLTLVLAMMPLASACGPEERKR